MKFKKYQTLVALSILFLLIIWGVSNHRIGKNFSASDETKNISSEQEKKFYKNTGTGENYLVKRVIDGDTIELENGERVRYIGIDTPETVDPRKPVQCFGKEAARANRELVEGKLVRLEKDFSDKDKYGRLLRYIYQEDKFINLELVKNGYAYVYTYPPDVKKSKLFLEAQKKSREARLGLWGICPQKIN